MLRYVFGSRGGPQRGRPGQRHPAGIPEAGCHLSPPEGGEHGSPDLQPSSLSTEVSVTNQGAPLLLPAEALPVPHAATPQTNQGNPLLPSCAATSNESLPTSASAAAPPCTTLASLTLSSMPEPAAAAQINACVCAAAAAQLPASAASTAAAPSRAAAAVSEGVVASSGTCAPPRFIAALSQAAKGTLVDPEAAELIASFSQESASSVMAVLDGHGDVICKLLKAISDGFCAGLQLPSRALQVVLLVQMMAQSMAALGPAAVRHDGGIGASMLLLLGCLMVMVPEPPADYFSLLSAAARTTSNLRGIRRSSASLKYTVCVDFLERIIEAVTDVEHGASYLSSLFGDSVAGDDSGTQFIEVLRERGGALKMQKLAMASLEGLLKAQGAMMGSAAGPVTTPTSSEHAAHGDEDLGIERAEAIKLAAKERAKAKKARQKDRKAAAAAELLMATATEAEATEEHHPYAASAHPTHKLEIGDSSAGSGLSSAGTHLKAQATMTATEMKAVRAADRAPGQSRSAAIAADPALSTTILAYAGTLADRASSSSPGARLSLNHSASEQEGGLTVRSAEDSNADWGGERRGSGDALVYGAGVQALHSRLHQEQHRAELLLRPQQDSEDAELAHLIAQLTAAEPSASSVQREAQPRTGLPGFSGSRGSSLHQPRVASSAQAGLLQPQRPVSAQGGAAGGVEPLLCSLTQERLRDPVIAADGMTYERRAMEAWLAARQALRQPLRSPVTGARLTHAFLLPNLAVRALLDQ